MFYEEEAAMEEESVPTPAGSSKHYEWQLYDGHQWLSVENDDDLESNYCKPRAKSITVHTANLGKLHIDFDKMQIVNSPMKVQRLTTNQREEMSWYFRDEKSWREYGSQGSSVNSKSLEHHFTQNAQGTVTFTVGFTKYSLDFSSMTQTNCSTGQSRRVRRRPKCSSVKWEFDGELGWTEYQPDLCSFGSAGIEAQYQQNPQGQMNFIINRFSYTLDFAKMHQVNDKTKYTRKVRRTDSKTQTNRDSASSVQWQFQDDDGKWKEYSQGRHCSISSQDIERHYQQNQSGTLKFSTRNFDYELYFGAMIQKNLSTDKKRKVRRLEP